ncbi:MAG: rod shape-determining protein MreD [Paracoccaceae bacterium]|nr:rod shape-determining protein MreD [Paracoccaceae bacterium]
MVERLRGSVWVYRAVFVGLSAVLLFLRLLPIGGVAGGWPGPDLMLCLMLAWVTQRPDHLPAGLIAAVVLTEDLILMRPPGLWAALVVLATEFLRGRSALTRELGFATEWLLITGVVLAMLLGYRVILAVAFVDLPGIGFALAQGVGTILCYPAVLGVLRLAINLRKPSTGEVDAFGRRL